MKNKFSIILAEKMVKTSDISKNTGISRTTLTSLYYKRTKSISINILDKLCNYLNCTVEDIFETDK